MVVQFESPYIQIRVTPAMEQGLAIMFGTWKKLSVC